MIVFDLICRPAGHVFEAWFGSSEDYQGQRKRGLVQCPLCGDPDVGKAVTAPRLAKGLQMSERASEAGPPDSAEVKHMLAALASAQKELLQRSEYVGDRFADEARAIHVGDAHERPIYGRATPEQSESLIDDGIPVAPLPFPVIEPGKEN